MWFTREKQFSCFTFSKCNHDDGKLIGNMQKRNNYKCAMHIKGSITCLRYFGSIDLKKINCLEQTTLPTTQNAWIINVRIMPYGAHRRVQHIRFLDTNIVYFPSHQSSSVYLSIFVQRADAVYCKQINLLLKMLSI